MRVVVRQGSWHYRYWKWLQDPLRFMDRWSAPSAGQMKDRAKEPTAICGYFWKIALSPLMLGCMAFAGLAVAALAACLGAVVGSGWLIREGFRRSRRTVARHPSVTEPVSLAEAFAKAKKQRVCPLIEVRP